MFVNELVPVFSASISKIISNTARTVFVMYAAHANNEGMAWPKTSRICELTGLHQDTVRRARSELVRAGLLERAGECVFKVVLPSISENHTAQNLDMVDHAHAPVIAKSATTESVPTQPIPAAPVRTVSEDAPKTETKPATSDNQSPVEQSGNSGMLTEPPASAPTEVKSSPTQLPAIVMAENAKPHNVSDEFMQELNARPIVAPKPVDDANLRARALRLQALQAENSARSRAEKLAERGLLNAGESGKNNAAPESALATATPADNSSPVKTEEQAVKTEELPAKHEELPVKTEELAAPVKESRTLSVEAIAQPAPDTAAPLPVVVHESNDSAPQPALPIIDATQTVAPQQGELLPAPVTAGQGELQPVKSKRCKSVAVQGELLPMETKKRATRLPEDWQLPRSWGMWAMEELGFTEDEVRFHAKQFADHWCSTTRNPCKVSWLRTWRKWMRDEYQKKQRYNNRPQQKSKTRMAMERLISMSGGDFEIPF